MEEQNPAKPKKLLREETGWLIGVGIIRDYTWDVLNMRHITPN